MQEILPWRQIRERTSDGELGRTVNPLPLGLAGSNPAAPTHKNSSSGGVGQPRLIWGQEHAVKAGARSNRAYSTMYV